MTGNILGAWLGFEAIESRWKNGLELYDVLMELADDLCTAQQLPPDTPLPPYSCHCSPASRRDAGVLYALRPLPCHFLWNSALDKYPKSDYTVYRPISDG